MFSVEIGFFRLGFIIEFIPVPAIAGFMTGSAITIASSQLGFLLGTSSRFKFTDSCYLVIIHALQNLPKTKVDAAFGLPCLLFLYLYRFSINGAAKRYPQYKRW